MTRRERYQVPRIAVHPWKVIFRNTLRRIWRDPIFWLEAAMLTLLSLLAALATPGSPTAGDGAIQMTAIAYTAVPFYLVLVVGQLTLRAGVEASWWSRPVTRGDYYFGRFLGLVVLGMALMGFESLFGGMTSALIAHLPIGLSLLWNLGLMLGFTLSSLVLVAGLYLWLAELSGGGHRYYPIAIILALILAFAEYKLPDLTALWPRLGFFNPFPAFLALGLSLPPALLGQPPLPDWLLINRLAWLFVGLALVALSMTQRQGYSRHYVRAGKGPAITALFIAVAVVAGSVVYAPWVAKMSPKTTPVRMTSASWLLTRPDSVIIHADAATGIIVGSESIRVPRYAIPPKALLLNRGLSIQAIALAGQKVRWHATTDQKIVVGTAATIDVLTLHHSTGGSLIIRFRGHLLPSPSPLPYAPFTPSHAYETMALGQGRLFLNGVDTWFPIPMLTQRHGFETLPVKGSLRLSVSHLSQDVTVITDLHRVGSAANRTWTGTLAQPIFEAAPYQSRRIGVFHIFLGRVPSSRQRGAYTVFSTVWPRLAHVLGISSTLNVVESPVSNQPRFEQNTLVISGIHPYAIPVDPILNTGRRPSPLEAKILLAQLWWQGTLTQWGTYPWQGRGMQPAALSPALTTITVLASLPTPARRTLYHLVKRDQALPILGPLTPSQTRLVETLAPLARTQPAALWAKMFRQLRLHWPNLDNQKALATWIALEVKR